MGSWKPDGTYKKQLDITRIKSIGWEPSINLDSGIDKAIDAFINEKVSYSSKIIRKLILYC